MPGGCFRRGVETCSPSCTHRRAPRSCELPQPPRMLALSSWCLYPSPSTPTFLAVNTICIEAIAQVEVLACWPAGGR